jgi:RNA polymerase sigma-70 factor (ECF subfamily)
MKSREATEAIESVVRTETPRVYAALIRVAGSFDLAEDALQEALASAVAHWGRSGVPNNPGAWIMAVAQRKLIDFGRRARTRQDNVEALSYMLPKSAEQVEPEPDPADIYPDDRLRLIFTCCHPALNIEARVALTLRTLGGLTTKEIARAFLVPESTLAQRIVRAKNKITEARIPYQVPPRHLLRERLDSVLAVIYLIFNEGYAATVGESLIRSDLAADAIRLSRTVNELLPQEPEALGLLALMLLHDARQNARISAGGELVPLEDQDRSLWNQEQIAEGLETLDQALRHHSPGPYQLQAAIAATHASAITADQTDWAEIAALYGQLVRRTPTPVVALNHAVALAMAQGLEEGLTRIDRLGASCDLDGYHLFHAARADLLRRLGRHAEASDAYGRALKMTSNSVEASYLRRRMASIAQVVDFPEVARRTR